MHELMQSPRWWEGRPPIEVIGDLNREVRRINGSSAGASAAILANTGTSLLNGATGLLVGIALNFARPALEKIAPKFCDRLDRIVTGGSREGVLLAKIRRTLT
jgi:hypothetical protein